MSLRDSLPVRRIALALGVLALGVGLAVATAPGLAVEVDPSVVTVVGLGAVLQAGRVLVARRSVGVDETTMPTPEHRVPASPPGDEFSEALEEFFEIGQLPYSRAGRGLREAAIEVLVRYEGLSREGAERRVEAGTWTDDEYAAAFLGGEAAPDMPEPGLLRRAVTGGVPEHVKIRRAVNAIAETAGLDPRPDADAGGFPPAREDSFSPVPFSVAAGATDSDGGGEGDDTTPDTRPTNRWRGVGALGLLALGVGAVTAQPAALLASAVGVGYAAYARSSALSTGAVSVERTVSTRRPDPGETVDVTVTVENGSGRPLPDVRVVDGVPEGLSVESGSPRFGTALRSGERATFTYEVTATRGVHDFGPAAVVSRDLAAAVEGTQFVDAETTLTCRPRLRATTEPVPLRQRAARYTGRVETDTAGAGLEFYATREYRPGDALNRIDWNRRARTGELSTVEFRSERAATVVVVVDAREFSYAAPDPGTPHALDRGVDAAGRLFESLSGAGNRVGIAGFPSESCWLPPGAGADHRKRARDLLATDPVLSPVHSAVGVTAAAGRARLHKRLSPGTQVVFVSPLSDDDANRLARWLDEYGYPVTVLSPDPTADRTAGHRLARVARGLRMRDLRGRGIPVIDWGAGEPVDVALARSNRREGP